MRERSVSDSQENYIHSGMNATFLLYPKFYPYISHLITCMPIPKGVAVFNKYVTNRLFLLFAGWIPPLAIVNHQGRSSGHSYRTPIMAFPTEDGFVLALTYGRRVDWVKNLIASRYGILEYIGKEFEIYNIRVTKYDEVKRMFPLLIRSFLSIISVDYCLIVENKNQVNLGR